MFLLDQVQQKLCFCSTSVAPGGYCGKADCGASGGWLCRGYPSQNVVERLRIAAGDNIFFVETEQGVLLTPYDPNFERAMQIYERGAKKYRNALHELAKLLSHLVEPTWVDRTTVG